MEWVARFAHREPFARPSRLARWRQPWRRFCMATGMDWHTTLRRVARLGLIALLVVMSPGVHAVEPIRVRVLPAFALGPADVIVETIVEPDARNREVEIMLDSSNYASSSTVALEGDQSPRVREIRFRQLPAGAYEVSATLVQDQGIRSTVAVALQIR
jgi:hypothetical protein